MMDRDEIRQNFSPLLDGELPPDERAAIESALSEDADLLRELDGLKRVDDLFSRLPSVTAPEDFESRVRHAIRPNTVLFGPRRSMGRRVASALAVAAALLVVAGAAWIQYGAAPNPMHDLALNRVLEEQPRPSRMAPSSAATVREQPDAAASQLNDRDVAVLESLGYTGTESTPAPEAPAAAAPATPRPMVSQEPPADEMGSIAADGESTEQYVGGMPADEAESIYRLEAKSADSLRPQMKDTAAEPRDAPAPSNAPESDRGESLSSAGSSGQVRRMAGLEVQREAASGMTEDAKEEVANRPGYEFRRLGEREFDFRDGVWTQRGISLDNVTPIVIERGSDALDKLLADHPDLEQVMELSGTIYFKAGDTVYRVKP